VALGRFANFATSNKTATLVIWYLPFLAYLVSKNAAIPERNCNRLRALAIVVLRGKMMKTLGKTSIFQESGWVFGVQEVAGSSPVAPTF
jgi:hypothetical protein